MPHPLPSTIGGCVLNEILVLPKAWGTIAYPLFWNHQIVLRHPFINLIVPLSSIVNCSHVVANIFSKKI